MSRVAITGVSGHLGAALARRLEQEKGVDYILGIDRKAPAGASGKVRFHEMDVRDEDLPKLLREERIQRIFHLAWVFDPTHSPDVDHDVNVKGTENVLGATVVSGARQLLYVSDMTAYGAYEDNPPLLTEDMPLRGNPDFLYAADKALVERTVESFARAHPSIVVSVLRPGIILGPGFDNYITRLMTQPLGLKVSEGMAPLQFAHVDDVTEALALLARKSKPGVFNCVGPGCVPYEEAARLLGVRLVKLPWVLAYAANGLLWALRTPIATAPPAVLAFLRHPWLGSNEKIERELGFKPRYSSLEALEVFAAARKR